MTTLRGAVGIRNGTQQVANLVDDQRAVIGLLLAIDSTDGGKRGMWASAPAPGPRGQCPTVLADAIRDFQTFWVSRGQFRTMDGVVDPGGRTLRKLDELAAGAGGSSGSAIRFRQTNPATLTNVHAVTQMVISPLTNNGMFQEISQTGMMQEFLFEMQKDGSVYWVGAAVPQGTIDFTKAQVFFHPTVRQGHQTHAADADYPTFGGGWSRTLQRYVAMQGGQLAGARQTVLLVPFMTMAATGGSAPAYMFATRPVETLQAIMTAVRDEVVGRSPDTVQVSRIGVSSFSSGIGAMRLFIRSFTGGRIVETTDFDSPYIVSEPKTITRSPGAVGRVFTQVPPPVPQMGWMTMLPRHLRNVTTFRREGPHAQIGWMTFFNASLSSVIL